MNPVSPARSRFLFACALVACVALPGAASTAAAAAAPVQVVRNVHLPASDGTPLAADIWRRGGSGDRAVRRRPVALLVHGGGWRSGDRRQWERSRWAQRLAQRGWLVVNTSYRLACTTPGSRLCGMPMRTSMADVRAALRFTGDHATEWGGDPARIVLFGASAGAHLAMLAGSDPARPPGVRAVVAISPPTDLAWIGARPELPIHAAAAASIGCPPETCAQAWRRASPLHQVRRAVTPPTWMFDAAADPITPVEPVAAYADRLHALDIDATLVTAADPAADCHGAIPCSGVALAGSDLDLFDHAQTWLRPHLR